MMRALPKLNSPRPSAVSHRLVDAEAQPLSEWKAAVSAEATVRKQIAKVQRELLRKRQMVAMAEAQRAKDANAARLLEQLEENRGATMVHITAHVLPLHEDEVTKLAELLNHKCTPSDPKTPRIVWSKCFKLADTDNSGRIAFSEFSYLFRSRDGLAMSHEAMSDDKLCALWKALDTDGSGKLSMGEFGAFMRRGEPAAARTAAEAARARLAAARLEAQRRQTAEEHARSGRDVTAQLAAVAPATDEEVCERVCNPPDGT